MDDRQGNLFGPTTGVGAYGQPLDAPTSPPVVPSNGTATSDAAARSIEGGPYRDDMARVLACVLDAGPEGRTCEEVETLLAMKHQSASSKLNRLHARTSPPPIRDSGRTRRTSSGRPAVVWVDSNLPETPQ